ncbi:MAG: hypothetical protein ACPGN3_09710 [Opitutales bacterium]
MHPLKTFTTSLLFLCATLGFAQINDALFTVGTTTRGQDSRDWAYILWQSEDLDLLSGGNVAIYRKDGDATSINPYSFEGLTSLQTNTTAIRALLQKGAQIGDDLLVLDERITDMFDIPFSGDLELEDKVSAIMQAAQVDERYFENVVLLSRLHPALSLCMGQSWASPIPGGISTFEVRYCDDGDVLDPDNDCVRVIGRITVDSLNPQSLPSPGPVVEVPIGDGSAVQRDLNLRMRWGTPDPLRELSLLYFGFDVYRVTKTFGDSQGWNVTAPLPSEIIAAAETPGTSDSVARVNDLPILVDTDLTNTEAADLSDYQTFFHIDDNGRFLPGGEPFANGSQFYYFVAARDVLGRIGELSDPSLVTICDQLPPPSPADVSVENTYVFEEGNRKQHLKVLWQAPELDADEASEIATYEVYRWESSDDFVQNRTSAHLYRIATLSASSSVDGFFEYTDKGPGAPEAPTDYGKTFIYTVRATDSSACGGNYSPHSNTALGILRDREGPGPFDPEGVLTIECGEPEIVDHTTQLQAKAENDDILYYYFEFSALALNDTNLFAIEYWLGTVGSPNELITTQIFPGDLNSTDPFAWSILKNNWTSDTRFFARAFTYGNNASSYYEIAVVPPADGTPTTSIEFLADYTLNLTSPAPGCNTHEIRNDDGSINPIDFFFVWPSGAESYRLYRSVDDGPQTFVAEGSRDLYADSPVEEAQALDPNPPFNASSICYYIQFFDVHGNPSQMYDLGCIETTARTKPPTPLLTQGESLGDHDNPIARIRWLCSPYGVERFVLWISPINQPPLETLNDDDLETFLPTLPIVSGDPAQFASFRTGRVGASFIAQSPGDFAVEFPVEVGVQYRIIATSLDSAGTLSDLSNEIQYSWTGEDFDGPVVPWPWRPVPSSVGTASIDSKIVAEYFNDVGIGIRFGDTAIPNGETLSSPGFNVEVAVPLDTFIYSDSVGKSLFPAAIYRVQVSNDLFPNVSGDVVQVSPLFELENLATGINSKQGSPDTYQILEPYIFVAYDNDGSTGHGLYLADTNPVLGGADYTYFILRFSETGEIDRIFTTNTVSVP